MSSKNKLQEYFQKNKIFPLPKYETDLVGGEPHKPKFQSSISFKNENFKSDVFSTKKDAEQDVAQKVLEKIENTHKDVSLYDPPKTFKRYILIDLENISVNDIKFDESYIVGFMSHGSLYDKKDYFSQCMDVKVAYSSTRDSADVLLIMFLTSITINEATKNPNDRTPIYIVTKDHFASAVVDICKDLHPVFHITSLNDL